MAHLILYGTAGCHLCEEAEALLAREVSAAGYAAPIDKQDIATCPELMERYGLSIPVLRDNDSGRELNWPFDAEDLRQILSPLQPDGQTL